MGATKKHTYRDIIVNQKSFRDKITKSLKKQLRETRKNLREIDCQEQYIISEQERLLIEFKKKGFDKIFERLFFMHRNRNKVFYVWYDSKNEEAVILRY